MTAWFRERQPNSGVDEKAQGGAAMIVPVHGSNVVQLEWGAGLKVAPDSDLIRVQEVDSNGFVRKLSDFGAVEHGYYYRGSRGAGIDIGAWESFPGGRTSHIRYFNIYGATKPTDVQVTAKDKDGTQTHIRVVALDQRIVKLAIRPVVVDDGSGKLIPHSRRPFDTAAMVKGMNSIWTPQANVVFDLVSSEPAPITDQSEIAKMLDLKTTNKAPLPDIVSIQKFAPIFMRLKSSLKSPQANFTMFLVKQAQDGTSLPNGVTDAEKGFALIGDSRLEHYTMAHEAGHFLGSIKGPRGDLVTFRHKAPPGGLMSLVSYGYKIPFDYVIDYFNPIREQRTYPRKH
jgi:hypothetical protein